MSEKSKIEPSLNFMKAALTLASQGIKAGKGGKRRAFWLYSCKRR